MRKPNVMKLWPAVMLACSAALMGCAAPSPAPMATVLPDVPQARAPLPAPKLMKRPQPERFSGRAQADIESWTKKLQSLPAR